MPRGPTWTVRQLQIAQQMRADGCDCKQIGAELGKTKMAVKCKLRSLSFSKEKRAKLAKQIRSAQRASAVLCAGGGRDIPYVPPSEIAPPVVLQERDRAFARPLTLSAALLGDPPPGRSALDRMGRQ